MTQQRIDRLEAEIRQLKETIQDLELTLYLQTRLDQMFTRPDISTDISLDAYQE